jgi:putative transcriptional regulator
MKCGGIIMFRYKIDVLHALKEKGYNSTKLRKEKLLGENAIQSLRKDEMVGIIALEKLCSILEMQPGDIIEYVSEKTLKIM